MGIQIPWLLVCVSTVPIFMIYTKTKRMDARETHEIQMRLKYHSEYWKKGNVFVKEFQEKVAAQVMHTADPLVGRDMASISATELAAAENPARARRWTLF
ncbi:hypothetical protein LSCM1_05772 [Leishmania martiniquensis]|uniref:Uncharacterized protein n=1 Tax=Leishmania martiniquensis TaxID=1580590 RepID=A0A836H9I6_9TRYP|nr:hypothetical protein LSCM1_05772 [Leishmania martiniquensis]